MVVNNMERSQANVAIIPLMPDYDELSIHCIKQSKSREINGVTEKTTIEILQLSLHTGTYKLLIFIREFNWAKEILSWMMGPTLFQKFQILFEGFHHETWFKEANAVSTWTVQHFADALAGFKSQPLETKHYDN